MDDDASVRKSLTRLLGSAGFAAQVFANPQAFLEHITNHSVAVAVLDIWMESMTGMELLAHLCARSPNTRVIFITAHEDNAARATVMQAGAFDFFVKPFDPDSFLDSVERAFKNVRRQKTERVKPVAREISVSGSKTKDQ